MTSSVSKPIRKWIPKRELQGTDVFFNSKAKVFHVNDRLEDPAAIWDQQYEDPDWLDEPQTPREINWFNLGVSGDDPGFTRVTNEVVDRLQPNGLKRGDVVVFDRYTETKESIYNSGQYEDPDFPEYPYNTYKYNGYTIYDGDRLAYVVSSRTTGCVSFDHIINDFITKFPLLYWWPLFDNYYVNIDREKYALELIQNVRFDSDLLGFPAMYTSFVVKERQSHTSEIVQRKIVPVLENIVTSYSRDTRYYIIADIDFINIDQKDSDEYNIQIKEILDDEKKSSVLRYWFQDSFMQPNYTIRSLYNNIVVPEWLGNFVMFTTVDIDLNDENMWTIPVE